METENVILFPKTNTKRLSIREFVDSDRPALDGFVQDPEQLRYMMLSMKDGDEADSFLYMAKEKAQAYPRLEFHLAVEAWNTSDHADKALVGGIALMREHPEHPEAELGYFFFREHWGKGYAVEASRVLIEFAFDTLHLHRIWGMCHSENTASFRVMEKLGMVREGLLREHRVLRGEYRSSYIFGILNREWRDIRNSMTSS